MTEPNLELSEEEWRWVRDHYLLGAGYPLMDYLLRVEAGRQRAIHRDECEEGSARAMREGKRNNCEVCHRSPADWLAHVRREKLGGE